MYHRYFSVHLRTLLQVLFIGVLGLPLAAYTQPATQSSVSGSNAFQIDDALNLNSARAEALSPDGQWLAVSVGSTRDFLGVNNYRDGDPTYDSSAKTKLLLVNTKTAEQRQVFSTSKAIGRSSPYGASGSVKWSPDSNKLVIPVIEGGRYRVNIYDVSSGRLTELALPQKQEFAWSRRSLVQWGPDGKFLYLPLRPEGWREKAQAEFKRLTKGPVTVYSSEQPFLAWEALKRESLRHAVVSYDLSSHEVSTVLPAMILNDFHITGDGKDIVYLQNIMKKTDYTDLSSSYPEFVTPPSDIKVQAIKGGKSRTLVSTTAGTTLKSSNNHKYYAWSTKEGDIYFSARRASKPKLIVKVSKDKEEQNANNEKDGEKDDDNSPFTVIQVSDDGSQLIASNKKGLWLVNSRNGQRKLFVEMPADDKSAPKYKVVAWSNDGDDIYLSYSAATKWERGFSRYNVSSGKLESLEKSGNLYNKIVWGIELETLFSDNNRTLVFSYGEANHPLDIYATDPDFRNIRKLTNINPQLANKNVAKTELISYLDSDGKKLDGVLYYPVNYQRGKKYPTIFIVYEKFFDNVFDSTTSLLTSQGYAVVFPSVNLEIGHPGEAWVKGVTAAANSLIERGITDGERMGIQGISYGGYATNLLVTQTDRFKAAINISGKADMISFYTDSPRLGIRNIHAPENSQDRLGGTMWEAPLKYILHTAVLFADRVTTPLLLITGDQDHNVPARTSMEMYYALRRLDKKVEWVNYMNSGHGAPNTTEADLRDYYQRIFDWYDQYLKKSPADSPAP